MGRWAQARVRGGGGAVPTALLLPAPLWDADIASNLVAGPAWDFSLTESDPCEAAGSLGASCIIYQEGVRIIALLAPAGDDTGGDPGDTIPYTAQWERDGLPISPMSEVKILP